jgi:hypothetical protein
MKTNKFLLFISVAIFSLLINSNKLFGKKTDFLSSKPIKLVSWQKSDTLSEWQELYFFSMKIEGKFYYYLSSSELDRVNPFEDIGKYEAFNLVDHDPNTAWVEGVEGNGEGEYAFISIGTLFPDSIKIINGYQKSKGLYYANSRPKKLKLSFFTGYYLDGDVTEIATVFRLKQMSKSSIVELQDLMGNQDLKVTLDLKMADLIRTRNTANFMEEFKSEIQSRAEWCDGCSLTPEFQYFLKIEIVEVYPGTKWEDCCISDLELFTTIPEYTRIPDDEKIINIYEQNDEESNLIYVKTNMKDKIVLADRKFMPEYNNLSDNENLDIVLMDVSNNKEWAVIDVMINHSPEGKVEEYSLLFYVPELLKVDESILDIKYGIFGFVEEGGELWLDTVDGYINLDKLKQKITKK